MLPATTSSNGGENPNARLPSLDSGTKSSILNAFDSPEASRRTVPDATAKRVLESAEPSGSASAASLSPSAINDVEGASSSNAAVPAADETAANETAPPAVDPQGCHTRWDHPRAGFCSAV